jgi:hypothetical protein
MIISKGLRFAGTKINTPLTLVIRGMFTTSQKQSLCRSVCHAKYYRAIAFAGLIPGTGKSGYLATAA